LHKTIALKKIVIGAFIGFLTLYLLPFAFLLSSKNNQKFVYSTLLMSQLADSITQNAKTDQEKVLLLYAYINEKIKNPEASQLVIDQHPFKVLKDAYGSCDQQAHLLISLAALKGIEGRIIFLLGADSISHHSVAELKIDNNWAMFDPFYDFVYPLENGEIASVAYLVENEIEFKDLEKITALEYAKLFDKTYPFQVYERKPDDRKAVFVKKLILFNNAIFGDLFVKVWVGVYQHILKH
jgi:transglutaminase-like putative cysteine protease